MTTTIAEGYIPGCIGRITQLHANYYSASHGFDVEFEAKVARDLSEFCRDYEQGRDGIWLVLHEDNIEGSIVIDGKNAQKSGAHLRWFITSQKLT